METLEGFVVVYLGLVRKHQYYIGVVFVFSLLTMGEFPAFSYTVYITDFKLIILNLFVCLL